MRVVTEAPGQGVLTMADLRVFVECWDATAAFAEHEGDPGEAQPVVLTEGQHNRIRKIQADLEYPA